MFLVTCNEAFGYSHDRILNSSFVLLVGMLRERGYLMNRRAKDFHSEEARPKEEEEEWVEFIDFDTGKKKRVKKVSSV